MIYYIFNLGLSGWSLVALLVAYVVAIVFSISVHEFSHALVAYKFGDPTPKNAKRLSLNPFNHMDVFGILCFFIVGFGWAKPVAINPLNFRNYKKACRCVSVAGIISNLILAFIFSGLYFFFSNSLIFSGNVFLEFLAYLFMLMMVVNLSLAFFNLLPIYPLDGYQFLASFLRPDNKFLTFMQRYGTLILLILVISPLYDLLYSFVVGGIESGFLAFWGLF